MNKDQARIITNAAADRVLETIKMNNVDFVGIVFLHHEEGIAVSGLSSANFQEFESAVHDILTFAVESYSGDSYCDCPVCLDTMERIRKAREILRSIYREAVNVIHRDPDRMQ